MPAYNLFIKNLNNLDGRSIAGSDLIVLNGTIKKDLLVKTTSNFTVRAVPTAVRIGDILGVYDQYGSIIYIGVVRDINAERITSDSILSIFDDNWIYNVGKNDSIEENLKNIIIDDYQNSYDILLSNIFSAFDINTISNTNLSLEEQDENCVKNLMSFFYEIYENYGIIVNIDVPFEATTPTITIGIEDDDKLLLGNDTAVLRNFSITKETQDTNKLVIYSNSKDTYLGITEDDIASDPSINPVEIDGVSIIAVYDDIVSYNNEEYILSPSGNAFVWKPYLQQYLGSTTTEIKQDDDTNPIIIDGESVTVNVGDIVSYNSSKFVFGTNSKWRKFGKNSLGKTTTVIFDGCTTSTIKINDADKTAKAGDSAEYDEKTFVFNGSAWRTTHSSMRQVYYATTSGITTDSASLNRLTKVKTKIVFSDDQLKDLVGQYLREEMYNHVITVECILNNSLYDFSSFKLGQEADIYYNGEHYNSILTGYELSISSEGMSDVSKLTFGLVRNTLTAKLFKAYDS